ncbi:unnamed protein product [Caenorhabditis angaria]|uniref:Uncharacterized protein n=1 Tax=Caenorhabditis angaria TaxID=860376 RepID=A0A9P1IMH3_9PELO|nr:unnamed protein product [Caenorhabditis angaria]
MSSKSNSGEYSYSPIANRTRSKSRDRRNQRKSLVQLDVQAKEVVFDSESNSIETTIVKTSVRRTSRSARSRTRSRSSRSRHSSNKDSSSNSRSRSRSPRRKHRQRKHRHGERRVSFAKKLRISKTDSSTSKPLPSSRKKERRSILVDPKDSVFNREENRSDRSRSRSSKSEISRRSKKPRERKPRRKA